jgi:hypothetical protein
MISEDEKPVDVVAAKTERKITPWFLEQIEKAKAENEKRMAKASPELQACIERFNEFRNMLAIGYVHPELPDYLDDIIYEQEEIKETQDGKQ